MFFCCKALGSKIGPVLRTVMALFRRDSSKGSTPPYQKAAWEGRDAGVADEIGNKIACSGFFAFLAMLLSILFFGPTATRGDKEQFSWILETGVRPKFKCYEPMSDASPTLFRD
jgi:hypothetical protein